MIYQFCKQLTVWSIKISYISVAVEVTFLVKQSTTLLHTVKPDVLHVDEMFNRSASPKHRIGAGFCEFMIRVKAYGFPFVHTHAYMYAWERHLTTCAIHWSDRMRRREGTHYSQQLFVQHNLKLSRFRPWTTLLAIIVFIGTWSRKQKRFIDHRGLIIYSAIIKIGQTTSREVTLKVRNFIIHSHVFRIHVKLEALRVNKRKEDSKCKVGWHIITALMKRNRHSTRTKISKEEK